MWCLVEDNKIVKNINNPKALTIGGVQHPRTIFRSWSVDELKAIGIYEIIQLGSKKNTKFYRNSESINYNIDTDQVEKIITSTEQDLAAVKERMISENKTTVGSMLTQHDWQVLREREVPGKPMKNAVKTYRNSIRANGDVVEAAIVAATTIEELEALSQPSQTSVSEDVVTPVVDEAGNPVLDIDGNPTTTTESVTTITDHPAVLHNWPELGE